MKELILTLIFTGMIFGTAAISHTQEGDWRGGIRARVNAEYQEIERGVERGSLTRREARTLKFELDGIIEKINAMRQDGHLDRREREEINYDLDRLHRDIWREKRNDDRRPYSGDHRRY